MTKAPDIATPVGRSQTWTFTQLIDLSVGIIPGAAHEPWKPSVHYLTHEGDGLDWMLKTGRYAPME